MPSQLLTNDRISFVVAKPFTSRGQTYSVGDDFPQEEARDIEVFVRARYLIPVVDSIEDKKFIRHWHRHIRPKDEVLERLNRENVQLRMPYEADSDEVVDVTRLTHPQMTDEELDQERQLRGTSTTTSEDPAPADVDAEQAAEATHTGQYDPTYHTVVEVNEHLAQEPDEEERERILAVERDNRGRKGILEA
jgi:hypothetical protein